MRLVIPLLLTVVAGCVSHIPMVDDYRGPRSLPASLLEDFPDGLAAPIVAASNRELRDRPHFDVRLVKLPSPADGKATIDFEYYDVAATERTPVVVLLPIFNGNVLLLRYFARFFANQGWSAIVVMRERDPLAELSADASVIHANLADYRRVLDWVDEQPALDPSRIGLFGISLGAMDAVMLTAIDGRVDALVAAMAGGDLPYLAMNTRYRPVARKVQDMLEESGSSPDALYEQLAAQITTDPLALAPYVDAERVLLVMTRSDAIVPFEAQERLRASIGEPETLYLPTGHRSSVVFFPRLRNEAFEFLSRRFEQDHIAVAAN